ncbi:CRAL-TRIO domain-containing protein [Xylaria sp. FL1777]|nr:CRAL-TRIO domain-containing protein [Xylaria sp. FL1777]
MYGWKDHTCRRTYTTYIVIVIHLTCRWYGGSHIVIVIHLTSRCSRHRRRPIIKITTPDTIPNLILDTLLEYLFPCPLNYLHQPRKSGFSLVFTLSVSFFFLFLSPALLDTMSNGIHRVPSSSILELGFPKGHSGHLTDDEAEALVEFKALLEEDGLYKPGPPPSHDDPTLLRFLRARKWVPQDAYVQFSDTEKFRDANEMENLYANIDIDLYETSRKVYPRFTGRRDKRGIPFYIFSIGHLDSKRVSEYEKSTEAAYSKTKTDGKTPTRLLPLFALYENLTRFSQPLTSECIDRKPPNTPITLSTNIVDISHVSLRMFWNLKAHMQAASQLATAHYPETLDRIFIIGAPYFFSTVWGWVKRWFDPVTVSKIFVLSDNDVFPVLSTFLDPEDIPKIYGGKLDWTFFDEPAYDDGIMELVKWENGHTNFPPGPCYWRPTEDGTRLECFAVGTKNGQERREVVCTIPKESASKPDAAAETSAANGEKEGATDVESAANAVGGLAITDAKDSTDELSEKVASVAAEVADAPTETKAH